MFYPFQLLKKQFLQFIFIFIRTKDSYLCNRDLSNFYDIAFNKFFHIKIYIKEFYKVQRKCESYECKII